MQRTYSRGDMYYANLGKGVGSEQEDYRPVVIIQNNVGNRFSPTVIIAAISSKVGAKSRLPTHYFIDSEDGLELPSIILMEQLRTIDKHQLGEVHRPLKAAAYRRHESRSGCQYSPEISGRAQTTKSRGLPWLITSALTMGTPPSCSLKSSLKRDL